MLNVFAKSIATMTQYGSCHYVCDVVQTHRLKLIRVVEINVDRLALKTRLLIRVYSMQRNSSVHRTQFHSRLMNCRPAVRPTSCLKCVSDLLHVVLANHYSSSHLFTTENRQTRVVHVSIILIVQCDHTTVSELTL